MRRKGELSSASIDRGWPHQVVLPARFSERGSGYKQIHEFCADLTLCSRRNSLYHDRDRPVSPPARMHAHPRALSERLNKLGRIVPEN